MKYFEDVTLMTSEINKLGIEMLEGLLTEDKARLNKVYETMKALRPFLRNTIEYKTLLQNKVSTEIYLDLKDQVESEGEKYTVNKEFTVLAIGEGEEDLREIKLIFNGEKIDDTDREIKANASYSSYIDQSNFIEETRTELEFDDIEFLDTKDNFKRKFMNNRAKEIIKDKKLSKVGLDCIRVEVI